MVIPAAVLLVAIGAIVGGIYDLRNLHVQRLQLKAAANAAALEAARALDYPDNTLDRLEFAARAQVTSRLGKTDIDTRAALDRQRQAIEIALSAPADVRFPGPLSLVRTVSVSSRAELVASGGTVCMLALPDATTGAAGTIRIAPRAIVSAEGCVLHSDRADRRALSLAGTATITAGGFHRAAGDDMAGGETDEAPADIHGLRLVGERGDPLAARPEPAGASASCDHEDYTITGHETLSEGVYCGGLTIDGGTADLYAGTYILRDGPLRVTGGGRLRGEFVGFYLTGEGARLALDEASDITLTAPRSGEMAGILVRAARTGGESGADAHAEPGADDADAPAMRVHTLASADARKLTGTIYLPGDRLEIAGSAPTAHESDFTILVAGEIAIGEGARLALRTNYEGSPVPAPAGLGPTRQAVATLVGRPAS